MIITRASLLDFDASRYLLEQSVDEGAELFGVDLDENRALIYLADVLDNPDSLALAVRRDGYVVGILLAEIEEHVFLATRFTGVSLLYVLPEYRNPKLARELLRLVEQYAEKHNAVPMISQTSALRSAAFSRWLERQGYAPIGGNFVKRGQIHGGRATH